MFFLSFICPPFQQPQLFYCFIHFYLVAPQKYLSHHEKSVHLLEFMFQDTEIVLRAFVPFSLLFKKRKQLREQMMNTIY